MTTYIFTEEVVRRLRRWLETGKEFGMTRNPPALK